MSEIDAMMRAVLEAQYAVRMAFPSLKGEPLRLAVRVEVSAEMEAHLARHRDAVNPFQRGPNGRVVKRFADSDFYVVPDIEAPGWTVKSIA